MHKIKNNKSATKSNSKITPYAYLLLAGSAAAGVGLTLNLQAWIWQWYAPDYDPDTTSFWDLNQTQQVSECLREECYCECRDRHEEKCSTLPGSAFNYTEWEKSMMGQCPGNGNATPCAPPAAPPLEPAPSQPEPPSAPPSLPFRPTFYTVSSNWNAPYTCSNSSPLNLFLMGDSNGTGTASAETGQIEAVEIDTYVECETAWNQLIADIRAGATNLSAIIEPTATDIVNLGALLEPYFYQDNYVSDNRPWGCRFVVYDDGVKTEVYFNPRYGNLRTTEDAVSNNFAICWNKLSTPPSPPASPPGPTRYTINKDYRNGTLNFDQCGEDQYSLINPNNDTTQAVQITTKESCEAVYQFMFDDYAKQGPNGAFYQYLKSLRAEFFSGSDVYFWDSLGEDNFDEDYPSGCYIYYSDDFYPSDFAIYWNSLAPEDQKTDGGEWAVGPSSEYFRVCLNGESAPPPLPPSSPLPDVAYTMKNLRKSDVTSSSSSNCSQISPYSQDGRGNDGIQATHVETKEQCERLKDLIRNDTIAGILNLGYFFDDYDGESELSSWLGFISQSKYMPGCSIDYDGIAYWNRVIWDSEYVVDPDAEESRVCQNDLQTPPSPPAAPWLPTVPAQYMINPDWWTSGCGTSITALNPDGIESYRVQTQEECAAADAFFQQNLDSGIKSSAFGMFAQEHLSKGARFFPFVVEEIDFAGYPQGCFVYKGNQNALVLFWNIGGPGENSDSFPVCQRNPPPTYTINNGKTQGKPQPECVNVSPLNTSNPFYSENSQISTSHVENKEDCQKIAETIASNYQWGYLDFETLLDIDIQPATSAKIAPAKGGNVSDPGYFSYSGSKFGLSEQQSGCSLIYKNSSSGDGSGPTVSVRWNAVSWSNATGSGVGDEGQFRICRDGANFVPWPAPPGIPPVPEFPLEYIIYPKDNPKDSVVPGTACASAGSDAVSVLNPNPGVGGADYAYVDNIQDCNNAFDSIDYNLYQQQLYSSPFSTFFQDTFGISTITGTNPPEPVLGGFSFLNEVGGTFKNCYVQVDNSAVNFYSDQGYAGYVNMYPVCKKVSI